MMKTDIYIDSEFSKMKVILHASMTLTCPFFLQDAYIDP